MLKPIEVNNQDILNLQGDVIIPGDKSISHRSLMILAVCIGSGRISNLLESEDVMATKTILENFGIKNLKKMEMIILYMAMVVMVLKKQLSLLIVVILALQ